MIRLLIISLTVFCFCSLSAQQDPAANPTNQETATQTTPPPEQEPAVVKPLEIKMGKVIFPVNFIHAESEFAKGTYSVKLTQKEDRYFFVLSDTKNEPLIEEMAIIVDLKGRSKSITRGLLKGGEYFRIRLIRNNLAYLGYFLVKQPTVESTTPPEPVK